jgi:hypothetical protein
VACTNEMYVHHHEKQITGVLHPCTDASPPPSPSNSIGDAEQDSIAAPPARLSSTSTSARLPAERQHLSSSRLLARRGRPPRLGCRRSGGTSRPHVRLLIVDHHPGSAAERSCGTRPARCPRRARRRLVARAARLHTRPPAPSSIILDKLAVHRCCRGLELYWS